MNTTPFSSERRFQLWRLHASHSQLLLRSNPVDDSDTRVEVLFKGVEAVKLMSEMTGLSVRLVDSDERHEILGNLSAACPDGPCYAISCKEFSGFVVAQTYLTDESGRSYSDESRLLIE